MSDDQPDPTPDPGNLAVDPEAFKKAHSKYGDYLKKVGMPFEPEELEESEGDSAAAAERADDESE